MSDAGSTLLPSIGSSGNGYPTVTILSILLSLPSTSISQVIRVPWRIDDH